MRLVAPSLTKGRRTTMRLIPTSHLRRREGSLRLIPTSLLREKGGLSAPHTNLFPKGEGRALCASYLS